MSFQRAASNLGSRWLREGQTPLAAATLTSPVNSSSALLAPALLMASHPSAPRLRALSLGSLIAAACVCAPNDADAHGIWGHVHVTGWAIENLPPGDLRDFFADEEVKNAALFGAAFTDSGYWPQVGDIVEPARAYGEHTHWEPFIEDAIQWMRENDPDPLASRESRLRLAFIMGNAAHGLQDEVFDSLMLDHIAHNDQGGQENADPATDGFLFNDGVIRFAPEPYIPMEMLLDVYAGLNEDINEDVINAGVTAMMNLYLNDSTGPVIAESMSEQHGPELEWTYAHYLDPSIPGSLRAEILPTGAYLQALWQRLTGEWTTGDSVIYHFPAPGRHLVSPLAEHPGSTVSLIYGMGVDPSTVAVEWRDENGALIEHELSGTRWGSRAGRLVRLNPSADLAEDVNFSLLQQPGVLRTDGSQTDLPWAADILGFCSGRCDEDEAIVPSLFPEEEPDSGDAGVPDDADTGTDIALPADAGMDGDSSEASSGCALSARGGKSPAQGTTLPLFIALAALLRRRSSTSKH